MKGFQPPQNWSELWKGIVAYRKTLVAPVDTIGCDKLLDHNAPKSVQRYHTLVALMLSSQTRDEATAETMEKLLKVGLLPEKIAQMPEKRIDELISKVSFHNNKTKFLKATSRILVEKFESTPPTTLKELMELPGIGPKMAYLFLQAADGKTLGIGVDTHVHRLCHRFKWVPATGKSPEDTRKALESWLPKEHWGTLNKYLVGLGQTVCRPAKPRCNECQLRNICPNAFKEASGKSAQRKSMKSARDVDIEDAVENEVVKTKRRK